MENEAIECMKVLYITLVGIAGVAVGCVLTTIIARVINMRAILPKKEEK